MLLTSFKVDLSTGFGEKVFAGSFVVFSTPAILIILYLLILSLIVPGGDFN